jgi:hypothetical protein
MKRMKRGTERTTLVKTYIKELEKKIEKIRRQRDNFCVCLRKGDR